MRFVRFSFYKIANCIASCCTVRCTIICGAVHYAILRVILARFLQFVQFGEPLMSIKVPYENNSLTIINNSPAQ